MMHKAEHFSANVEGLRLTPTGLSLPVPAVPPTHELFGLSKSLVEISRCFGDNA